MVRTPQLIVFSVVQTVMFLLLFRYVFGGSIVIPGMSFVDYLIPGFLVQIAIFEGFGVAIFMAEDSKSGLIDRFRALPMARSAVVSGRAVADLLRQAVLLLIVLGVGYLVGYRLSGSFGGLLAALGLCMVWGFALFWVFAAIGLYVRDTETAQAAIDTVLPARLHLVVPDPRRHAAGLAAAVRPEPAAQPGRERGAWADGRQRRRRASSSTARGTTS